MKRRFFMGLQAIIMAVSATSVQANQSMSDKNLQTAAQAYETDHVRQLEKLNNRGNPFAAMMLARCYAVANACSVTPSKQKAAALQAQYDTADIMQVLFTLGMRGSQTATNWIANYYFDLNTPEGFETAYQYFNKNASVGNAYAAYRLGDYYYHGISPIRQNFSQAKNWYEKAAKTGHVKAMLQLASMYEQGRGVSSDAVQAANWKQQAKAKARVQKASQDTRSLEPTENKNTVVTTYFGTNRNKTTSSNPKNMFGEDMSQLTYGTVKVSIPKSHKVGEIESPFLWFKPDPNKHIMFPENSVAIMNEGEFYQRLSKKIQQSPRNNALVFIHGFNTSFESAAKRTAQMSYDLQFDGAPIFYSWPAKETIIPTIANYRVNEKNIQATIPVVTAFLTDVLQRTQAENVYLIAHSMGNRALIQSMVDMLDKNPALKNRIKEVILAAPDVDANVFKKDIAPVLAKRLNKPVTLYSSSNDMALMLSAQINESPRVGDAKYAGFIEGIENVDVSNIDTSFIGHSYYGENTSVISDIVCIIHKGMRADERNNLTERKVAAGGKNWLFEMITRTPSVSLYPTVDESCRIHRQ